MHTTLEEEREEEQELIFCFVLIAPIQIVMIRLNHRISLSHSIEQVIMLEMVNLCLVCLVE